MKGYEFPAILIFLACLGIYLFSPEHADTDVTRQASMQATTSDTSRATYESLKGSNITLSEWEDKQVEFMSEVMLRQDNSFVYLTIDSANEIPTSKLIKRGFSVTRDIRDTFLYLVSDDNYDPNMIVGKYEIKH
jgi:hypothetical protein